MNDRFDSELIGQYRSSADLGGIYLVMTPTVIKDGEWYVRIHILDSGEEYDYPCSRVILDERKA